MAQNASTSPGTGTMPTAARRRPRLGMSALALGFVVLALVFAALASMWDKVFYLRLATDALILAGLAISVDLLLGYTGLLSLGQAMFFGLGAYASAVLLRDYGAGFWGALAAVLALNTPVALLAGAMAIRSRGVYFILITFGLAQVVAQVIYNTPGLGGSNGMVGIPLVQANFGLFQINLRDPLSFFLLMLAVIMGLYLTLSYLMHTPFGRTLLAIRSNENRLRFLGFNPWRYKLAIYVIAGDVAALSGAFYPMLRGFVSPELLSFEMSANAVIMTILGGVGTLIGPIYGSVILIGLETVIGTWTEHHLIVIGVLFMLAVIFMPRGLAGLVRRRPAARADDDGKVRDDE